MAFCGSPSRKIIQLSPTQKFAYIGLKTSLQKVKSKQYQERLKSHLEYSILNSPATSGTTSPHDISSPPLHKNLSPPSLKVSKTPFSRVVKHSDISLETFGNDSSSGSFSEEWQETKETTKTHSRKINSSQSGDFTSELDCCRKDIDWLKTRITKMQNSSFKTPIKNTSTTSIEKDVSIRLKKQKDSLLKKHKAEMQKQREELIKSFRLDFDSFNIRVSQKLKVEQKKILEIKEKDLQERVNQEILMIEKDSEAKLKLKLSLAKSDYDRQLKRVQDENFDLKKQVDSLKRMLEDSQAKCGVVKTSTKYEKSLLGSLDYETDNDYEELKRKFNELQRKYKISKQNNNGLCQKCKAFVKADEVISKKIEVLRNYIGYFE
ncbi:hypothetical protein SteCoe_25103 [Stentor coeruleus]|uniref:Uncharacterized protein n=1 Tax=Stentor coeruleus TaxID=5963 RepID=A0A1R2BFZ3_9CILI|nr:hypothetical protein SteCoe_25103 [Stentor coeruleus]